MNIMDSLPCINDSTMLVISVIALFAGVIIGFCIGWKIYADVSDLAEAEDEELKLLSREAQDLGKGFKD